jgi:hypothetical protein
VRAGRVGTLPQETRPSNLVVIYAVGRGRGALSVRADREHLVPIGQPARTIGEHAGLRPATVVKTYERSSAGSAAVDHRR